MSEGQVLEFDRVTKRFGDVTAVSEFSGRVEPGVVTGFLGPNGAGKTTTLRMLLGMLKPSSGSATIGGAYYADLKHAARVIGAMPEDPGFRARRSVERHLITAAKANGIPLARVGEVIHFVGLDSEAESRIATLSLGMRQRLSAATALLGDPGALVLDEPANGLDPEGIRWMRLLIRGLADEGRTVLVSSHVLSEVEQVADEILVIARGQRKFAGSLATLADPTAGPVIVDAIDRDALQAALSSAGFDFEILRSGLTVRGSDAATIGSLAAGAGVALTTLQQRGPTLEDVFLDLVNDRPVQFRKPEAVAVPATEPDATVALPIVAEPDAPVIDAAPAVDVAPAPDADAAVDVAPAPDADAAVDTAPSEHAESDAPQTGAAQDTDDVPAETEADTDASVDTEAVLGASADEVIDEAADTADAPSAPSIDPTSTVQTSVIEIASLVEDPGADAVDEALHADELPAEFAPVSAVESAPLVAEQAPAPVDRPLPGLAGLAAAAIGVTAPGVADAIIADSADSEGETEAPVDGIDEPEAEAEAEASDAADEAPSVASWSPVPDWMPKAPAAADETTDENTEEQRSADEQN